MSRLWKLLFFFALAARSRAQEPPRPPDPVSPIDFPDPFVLRVTEAGNSTYYAYATNANGKNVQAMASPDLAHWSELWDALPHIGSWANSGLTWAPAILALPGPHYVMFYTARDRASNRQCIGAASSAAPRGPFVDSYSAPLVCQSALGGSIDPSPRTFAGRNYLYWKSDENALGHTSRLWVQELTADGVRLQPGTDPQALLAYSEAWEAPLIEAPAMLFANNTYRLFYSANGYDTANYAVGYADCNSPTGPCTKRTVKAPWFHSYGKTAGPGGQEFFTGPDGTTVWMCFHGWASDKVGYEHGGSRSLRIWPLKDLPALG
eukprot:TRINITY_DN6689_c0_g1_i1.p1 TRINITY_DN6689_c0_g1~~TRINITY_DN6689_c0_g1_i1.p1  ORF type:complete len:328 (-),score=33.12 TRINITY_DN6689_c0_g1_i1:51-1010(-)